MSAMFYRAINFNQPLDDWNMASVTDMYRIFKGADNFNQCLSNWAYKTPPDVKINNIFQDSGCPDKVAVANVAPWCQGKDEK